MDPALKSAGARGTARSIPLSRVTTAVTSPLIGRLSELLSAWDTLPSQVTLCAIHENPSLPMSFRSFQLPLGAM